MACGCEPWKLLVSALMLAGSGYHFLHKYHLAPAEPVVEEQEVVRTPCSPHGCVCTDANCPRRKPKKPGEEICDDYVAYDKERRKKAREKMEEAVKEKWKKKQERYGRIERDPNRPNTV